MLPRLLFVPGQAAPGHLDHVAHRRRNWQPKPRRDPVNGFHLAAQLEDERASSGAMIFFKIRTSMFEGVLGKPLGSLFSASASWS
jgi:hypothetical protein